MKNLKDFPKSRITVVDVFPYFKEGFKRASEFCNKHNIPLASPDGMRVIFGYSVRTISDQSKHLKTQYPAVFCISNKTNNKKMIFFIETYFAKVIKTLKIPFCGIYNLNSPDLENAALGVKTI